MENHHWVHPFYIHHQSPDERRVAPLSPALRYRCPSGKGKRNEEYLYSAIYYACIVSMRSDMDHTVLPANYTMPTILS